MRFKSTEHQEFYNKAKAIFGLGLISSSLMESLENECKEESDADVKKYYNHVTENDPIIHSNRFPAWEELSYENKVAWREKYIRNKQP